MKNEALYNKTVDLLRDAYMKDELKHNYCNACAVGNICGSSRWQALFMTARGSQRRNLFALTNLELKIIERDVIAPTGYTLDELARIEFAFETAPTGSSDDEWMFNGLMAVVAVLDSIHENIDPVITTISRNKFNKALC